MPQSPSPSVVSEQSTVLSVSVANIATGQSVQNWTPGPHIVKLKLSSAKLRASVETASARSSPPPSSPLGPDSLLSDKPKRKLLKRKSKQTDETSSGTSNLCFVLR